MTNSITNSVVPGNRLPLSSQTPSKSTIEKVLSRRRPGAGLLRVHGSDARKVKGASHEADCSSIAICEVIGAQRKPLTGTQQGNVGNAPPNHVGRGCPAASVEQLQGDQVAATSNPRTSNTGVEITNEDESSQAALIDWLAFTLPAGEFGVFQTAADLAYRLSDGDSDVPALDRGSMGYTHGYRLPGSGSVLYNCDRPEMGVHCSLPAKSLAMVPFDPAELIKLVLSAKGKCTRLDVAMDSNETHINTVRDAIVAGGLVSRAQQRTYQGSFVEGDDGYTIYIGARSSDRFVRIYNKAAEQKLDDGSTWTRCEIEFKGKQAQMAAEYILSGVSLRSLIFSAIDFRDRSADSNTSRCPQLDWWAAWVGVADKVSFAVKTVEKTVAQAYEWIARQCGPTLAFLDEYFNKNAIWMYELADSCKERIPQARLKMIESTPASVRMTVESIAAEGKRRYRSNDRAQGSSKRLDTDESINLLASLKAAGEADFGLHWAFA